MGDPVSSARPYNLPMMEVAEDEPPNQKHFSFALKYYWKNFLLEKTDPAK